MKFTDHSDHFAKHFLSLKVKSTLCISNIKLITTNTFASFSVYISKHALSFRFFFKSAKYAFWLILIPKTCTFFIQFMLTNRRSFNSFTHTFRFAKTFSIKNVWNRRLFDRTFGIRQTPDSLQIKQNLTFYSNKLILIQKNPFQIKTIETNLVFSLKCQSQCKTSPRVTVVTKLEMQPWKKLAMCKACQCDWLNERIILYTISQYMCVIHTVYWCWSI